MFRNFEGNYIDNSIQSENVNEMGNSNLQTS